MSPLRSFGQVPSYSPHRIVPVCDIIFFILRKEYKKLLSFKERKFKEDLINKINDESCKETKHFWEIVDELKSLNSKINARNVTQFSPGEMWYDHFNKLLSKRLLSKRRPFRKPSGPKFYVDR